MNRAILYGLLVSWLTIGAFAQDNGDKTDVGSWGRGFFAPGFVASEWGAAASYYALGFGGEGRLGGGPAAVTLDLAWLAPYDSLSDGIGEFCPGMGYYFGKGRTQPFVNGGYTLFFRDAAASGIFFGGGVNHWINDHLGIGFEARDALLLQGTSEHFIQLRANFLFH